MSTDNEQDRNGMTEGDRDERSGPAEDGQKVSTIGSIPETPQEHPKVEEVTRPSEPLAPIPENIAPREEESPPVPAMPDLRIVLDDDSGVFEETVEPRMMSRVSLVKGLIEKHANFMVKYRTELETGVSVDPAVIAVMEEARGKRDELNVSVASLKERRTSLKEENRGLRKRFLEMLRIQEQLKEKAKDISEISEFIDRQEYKLMTEGVNLEAERKLMKDIKESMNSIRQLTGGYVPKEIEDELTTLDSSINANFIIIEEEHQKMLGLVMESQVHHQRFVDEAKKVREAEARKGWLQRRIALHNEMMKFWETQTANAEAMDASDVGRTSAQIKDRLIKEMEDAIKAEEQTRRSRKEGTITAEAEPPAEGSPPAGLAPETPHTDEAVQEKPEADESAPQGGSV